MADETCSAEATEQAVAESVAPVVPAVKRKYTKLAKGDFIRIANASQSVKEISDKTGMSYGGVRAKLKSIKSASSKKKEKCPLNNALFEDGRKKK